jgi:peptidoglycan/xylan/chitin deacetylase (PgdA/CDA1 family)
MYDFRTADLFMDTFNKKLIGICMLRTVRILNITIILVLNLSNSAFSQPWQYGQMFTMTWPDNRKAAFSFTFDDGTMSHYTYAKPILDSFGFKSTFFLATSFLTDDLPGIIRFGTWNQFREMSLEGHEIGAHSVTHSDITTLPTGDTLTPGTVLYELYQSQKIIEQKIPNQKCISFAYPSLSYNTNIMNLTSQFYESGRTGFHTVIDSALKGIDFYRIGAYEELFNLPRNSINDDLDELQDFKDYVQLAIYSGKWGMLEAHEVVPFSQIPGLVNSEWYPMSTEWLTSLCQWLKQKSDNNEIWVETMGNVIRYMKERELLRYDIIHETNYRLKINAVADLNKDIYNYPLTVLIIVPPDWNRVVVTQDSQIDTVNTIHDGADTYLVTHVIPNRGTLNLREMNLDNLQLPVELTNFTASVINHDVKLQWTTSTEINNNQFIIERMSANESWSIIGSIAGAGNSNSAKVYSLTDKSLKSNGKYSYRLKMIDNDGKFKYSDNIEIDINIVFNSYLLEQNYPNPFNPSTTIKYTLPDESDVTLTVFDAIGGKVTTVVNEHKPAGNYSVQFNSTNLPSGIYFYRLQAGSFVDTKKMLLMK